VSITIAARCGVLVLLSCRYVCVDWADASDELVQSEMKRKFLAGQEVMRVVGMVERIDENGKRTISRTVSVSLIFILSLLCPP